MQNAFDSSVFSATSKLSTKADQIVKVIDLFLAGKARFDDEIKFFS